MAQSLGATEDEVKRLFSSLVEATRGCSSVPALARDGPGDARHRELVAALLSLVKKTLTAAGYKVPEIDAVEAVCRDGSQNASSMALPRTALEALVESVDSLIEMADTSLDFTRGQAKTVTTTVSRTQLAGSGGDDLSPLSWEAIVKEVTVPPGLPPPPFPLRTRVAEGSVASLIGPLRIGRRAPGANARVHFVPLLASKPHALDSAPSWAQCDGTKPPVHPYEEELRALSWSGSDGATPWVLRRSTEEAFRPPTPAHWVDTPEAVAGMMAHLSEGRVTRVAVDVEAHTDHSFQGLTCLLQLSTDWEDFLVDTLSLGPDELGPLLTVFADPSVLKVLHGCDRDVVWLQRCCGLYLVNVFDTMRAARALDMPAASLAYLLEHFASVNADKSLQRADWRQRPLPPAMKGYACQDTHYLLGIGDRLRNQLLEGGEDRLLRVMDLGRELCLKVYDLPQFQPGVYSRDLADKSGTALDEGRGRVLEALCDWRDLVARALDESPHSVLPKRALLRVAEVCPLSASVLTTTCNPLPTAVQVRAPQVCRIVAMALEGRLGTAWASHGEGGSVAGDTFEPVQWEPRATVATQGIAEALVETSVAGSFAPDAAVLHRPSIALTAASVPHMTSATVVLHAPSSSSSVLWSWAEPPSAGAARARKRLRETPHLRAAGVRIDLITTLEQPEEEQATVAVEAESESEHEPELPKSMVERHQADHEPEPKRTKQDAPSRADVVRDLEHVRVEELMEMPSLAGATSAAQLVQKASRGAREITSRNQDAKIAAKRRRERKGQSDNPFLLPKSNKKRK
jgi:ribonuclease D